GTHRPDVRSIGNDVWRELVPFAVTGDEGHAPPTDRADDHRGAGGPERGRDLDPLDVLEERVEPRPTEHSDPDGIGGGTRQADRSLVGDAARSERRTPSEEGFPPPLESPDPSEPALRPEELESEG